MVGPGMSQITCDRWHCGALIFVVLAFLKLATGCFGILLRVSDCSNVFIFLLGCTYVYSLLMHLHMHLSLLAREDPYFLSDVFSGRFH